MNSRQLYVTLLLTAITASTQAMIPLGPTQPKAHEIEKIDGTPIKDLNVSNYLKGIRNKSVTKNLMLEVAGVINARAFKTGASGWISETYKTVKHFDGAISNRSDSHNDLVKAMKELLKKCEDAENKTGTGKYTNIITAMKNSGGTTTKSERFNVTQLYGLYGIHPDAKYSVKIGSNYYFRNKSTAEKFLFDKDYTSIDRSTLQSLVENAKEYTAKEMDEIADVIQKRGIRYRSTKRNVKEIFKYFDRAYSNESSKNTGALKNLAKVLNDNTHITPTSKGDALTSYSGYPGTSLYKSIRDAGSTSVLDPGYGKSSKDKDMDRVDEINEYFKIVTKK